MLGTTIDLNDVVGAFGHARGPLEPLLQHPSKQRTTMREVFERLVSCTREKPRRQQGNRGGSLVATRLQEQLERLRDDVQRARQQRDDARDELERLRDQVRNRDGSPRGRRRSRDERDFDDDRVRLTSRRRRDYDDGGEGRRDDYRDHWGRDGGREQGGRGRSARW